MKCGRCEKNEGTSHRVWPDGTGDLLCDKCYEETEGLHDCSNNPYCTCGE